MTKLSFVLLALGLGMAAPSAFAQEAETGTRLAPPKTRDVGSVALTGKDQAVGAKRMAECIFNRKRVLARQALQASTAEAANAAINKMMGEVTCFGDDASNDLVGMRVALIPPDILRGMLAEAAFKQDSNSVQALQSLPIQQVYQRNWFAITGRHVAVDEMGACIADTNPGGILALSRSVPTSKEESAAFSALGPNLGACLRSGTKLQASRQALRAALSEALYQRLVAPMPAPVATQTVEAAKK
jgi:hypothetical protein